MRNQDKIQLLLATYNAAPHLDAFMESLLAQDEQDWSLLVRDDGSADLTPALLETWRARLGSRMQILPDSGQCNLGVVGNFSRLLNTSTAPYIMFADQDDLWHSGKIRVTLAAMRQRESEVGTGKPILVHTDLAMVDENLASVSPSHWQYQGLVPERGHDLGHMMVENTVWGCTCMLNRPLIELTGDIPPESRFHDWWISLVAAAFGEIVSLPIQTISWRRHGANDSEITRLSEVVRRTLTSVPETRLRLARLLEDNRPRVRLFLDRYHYRLNPEQVAAVEAFLKLPEMGFWQRRQAILRHRLFFTSWPRTAGLLLLA